MSPRAPDEPWYFRDLRNWGNRWNLPQLADAIDIRFSARLTSSLGRAYPLTGRVTLHAALENASRAQVREVLCHEAAHIAAAWRAMERGVPLPKPHGPEWAALVRAAGFTPRLREALEGVGPRPQRQFRPSTYIHRCPVCHIERLARRPVVAWRCSECVAAGLEGRMEITRVSESADE